MNETALAVLDSGEANKRILAREEYRADFRRVEAASLKRRTALASGEGKRIFARCFYTFQLNMYFVSILGRTKLPHESIEQIEQAVRTKLEAATAEVNKAIDGAEALLKQGNIDVLATYDTVPLELEIGITSALGRRYFELVHKLDQLMPLIQTLGIEEVISEKQAEQQRSHCKRVVLAMASLSRNFAAGVRRRMNEEDIRKAERAKEPARQAAQAQAAEPASPEVSGPEVGAVASSVLEEGSRIDPVELPDAEPLAST